MNEKDIELYEVEEIIKKSKEFFETKQTLDVSFRINQLKKLRQAILDNEGKLIDALQSDLGKHPFESYATEIGFVLQSITYTIKNLSKWTKIKKVSSPIALFPAKSYIRHEPYGTVLIIGPFNYPFQLLIEPLIGAIAAGNCAVLKPSELVPAVAKTVTEMISATFDPSFVCIVEGGVETNKALLQGKFDYIFFTGSPAVGKLVMKAAAENLVPVTLELGGKSPAIVDETADIKLAADKIIWGKTVNAGQTCVAPDYVLAHERIKDELIEEMKKTITRFYGESVERSEHFGRIVNMRHFARLQQIMKAEEGSIVHGGGGKEDERFLEPTIISADWDSPSMQDEIFGPILPIIGYSEKRAAVKKVTSMPKALAMYIFTQNKMEEEYWLNTVPSGGVSINDTLTHLANPNLPFGGVGTSGIGSYHGIYSFEAFSHKRSVLKRGKSLKMTDLFPPYTDQQLKLVRRFLK
ncbi:aldehyde dehydrogenase [Bacillus sp. Au-Bac7]|uniref:aldehyde dehydrogenase n=1 Tax=Bacillus sp. Au-Bac7 TaxID=2906458 RepID=UPI001E4C1F2E|nr:aldehyde dehydrogenase [Bacillus sp. Au-Bac7]MCE4050294.1 aldehyde dehydrogenase [Bacillus sp. Au-Bac7]